MAGDPETSLQLRECLIPGFRTVSGEAHELKEQEDGSSWQRVEAFDQVSIIPQQLRLHGVRRLNECLEKKPNVLCSASWHVTKHQGWDDLGEVRKVGPTNACRPKPVQEGDEDDGAIVLSLVGYRCLPDGDDKAGDKLLRPISALLDLAEHVDQISLLVSRQVGDVITRPGIRTTCNPFGM